MLSLRKNSLPEARQQNDVLKPLDKKIELKKVNICNEFICLVVILYFEPIFSPTNDCQEKENDTNPELTC